MTRQLLKIVCLVAITLASMILTACVTTTVDNADARAPKNTSNVLTRDSIWALRLPEEESVSFKGVVSFDGAGGGAGSMVYPAPNAIGFVAAVITHGLMNQSVRNSEKNKLQEDADKVLRPYQPALLSYSHKQLMQRGLEKMPVGGGKKLVGHTETAGSDWTIESTPVFLMTQDQSAIILENSISIFAPGRKSDAVYHNPIRVVSQPKHETDLEGYWTAENGKRLKEESSSLFAESVEIALREALNMENTNNNAHKTFRYLEGNVEKMERGQLISERCDRVVIKTLRGQPMSIPSRRDTAAAPAAEQCGRVSSNLK